MRRATQSAVFRWSRQPFQSTLSLRRATGGMPGGWRPTPNFNPRSPCGERPGPPEASRILHPNFNPRSPCGERLPINQGTIFQPDFNPRSPCGERPFPMLETGSSPTKDFNPRSPCGERRQSAAQILLVHIFQSTLSLRRATYLANMAKSQSVYFNPRSPCGERRLRRR